MQTRWKCGTVGNHKAYAICGSRLFCDVYVHASLLDYESRERDLVDLCSRAGMSSTY